MRYILTFLIVSHVSFLDVSLSCALPSPTLRTIALTGQVAPGTGGAVYNSLSVPQIDAAGRVMFSANLVLAGPTTNSNNSGLWSDRSGNLSLIVREGDQAPDTPVGTNFGTFHAQEFPTTINASSQLMFRNNLPLVSGVVTAENNDGLWVERAGGLELVAREGGPAVGAPAGALWRTFDRALINGHGQVAFYGILQIGPGGINAEFDQGIWAETAGGLVQKMREGNIATALPGTVHFAPPSTASIRFNDAGQVAFASSINGLNVSAANNFVVWSEGSGSLNVVARRGDQAPGTPAGALFELNANFGGDLRFNGSGKTAFRAGLMNSPAAGVDGTNNQGIWSDASGSLSLMVRRGDLAPGTNGQSRFDNFLYYEMSDAGNLVISAYTRPVSTGNSYYGFWSVDAQGEVSLIAKDGDPAPGTPSGTTLILSRPSPILNPLGHVAFTASVTGAGVNSTNDGGLWAQDALGNLRLVLREGELLEVAPGDFRTLSTISIMPSNGANNGLPQSFNADYQLALQLSFTDQSRGIFTVRVTIPEPGTCLLAVLALAGILTRRERRG